MSAPRYFHVITANRRCWCSFDAAVIPGHEDDLKRAILGDMLLSSLSEVDDDLSLYEELHEVDETLDEYREHVISERAYSISKIEEYTLKDGCLENPSRTGALYGETKADAAKALPLNGKPFAFKVWRSGPNG